MKTIITQKDLLTFAIIRLARATSVIAALIFAFLALPVQAQPSITASQNPVIVPAGQTAGTTTLTWDGGGDHPYAELWQQVDGGNETFVVEQGKGTRQMTIEIGKTYIFKLSDFGTLLASVTVTAINEQPKPPGGSFPGGIVVKPGNIGDAMTNKCGELRACGRVGGDRLNNMKTAPLSQTVKVVFTSVKITNDSDPDIDPSPFPRIPVAGEIDLWFWINHGDPSAKGYAIFDLNNGSALTNHFYDIKKEFVIENAPKILTLSISGSDSDAAHKVRNGNFVPFPLSGPQDTGLSEENVAKSEWDLSRFPTAPGETYRNEFVISSMPNGGSKGDLSFEIHGFWEITRSN